MPRKRESRNIKGASGVSRGDFLCYGTALGGQLSKIVLDTSQIAYYNKS
jgi:hypothetical protein